MNRDDCQDRILYSYYLEKLYSTATGRVDMLLSILIFISGSSILLSASHVIFGLVVVVLTAIQKSINFGFKSGQSKKKSVDYQRLYTNESKYSDDDLLFRLNELESNDSAVWSSLEEIAMLKTKIQLGITDQSDMNLISTKKKFLRLFCG